MFHCTIISTKQAKLAQTDLTKWQYGILIHSSPLALIDYFPTASRSEHPWAQVYSSFKPQAYALILLRSNGRCVFYGDLYPCSFHDPEVAQILKQLIDCRKRFAYGPLNDYVANSPHRNCVGFTRLGLGPRLGCAVVLSNADPSVNSVEHTLPMNVGQANANQRYRNLLGDSGEIVTGADGWGSFRFAPGQVAVWIRETC